jgi:hypothetical protein
MTQEVPRVGGIVHYTSLANGGCLAAIITAVSDQNGDGKVNLAVFEPGGGMFTKTGVPFRRTGAEQGASGTWHWPQSADLAPCH